MESIPYHRPTIGEEEIAEVVDTLRSGWLTTGPRTAQFEKEFKAFVGAPHALAVNSCTAGLHLALAGLGIGEGDEVITTPLTFCATVNTILHVGATPVLADVSWDGNIDPDSIASRITPRTRCIMPVHLAGLPCRMEEIWRLARKHSLFVVEDAAHAAGAQYGGQQIGAGLPDRAMFSDAVAYSFYATKNLTTGEGGMVTTHDEELASRMRILCLHGISKDAWDRYTDKGKWFYEVVECGYKYNLSDIQSAIGIHQLRRLNSFTAERTRLATMYRELLQDTDEIELPDATDPGHAWHLYMIKLNLNRLDIDREEFMRHLRSAGVGASVHFIPIPIHPYFQRNRPRHATEVPRALAIYERLISLPLYPGLTDDQVIYIVDTITEIVRRFRKTAQIAVAS